MCPRGRCLFDGQLSFATLKPGSLLRFVVALDGLASTTIVNSRYIVTDS